VPVQVDINDERPLTDLVADYDIVVNAAGPEWETLVPGLRAAVAAGIHCCDLGADGRTAEQQLALDSTAKAQGVLALIGMGLDPGLDNLLAVHVEPAVRPSPRSPMLLPVWCSQISCFSNLSTPSVGRANRPFVAARPERRPQSCFHLP